MVCVDFEHDSVTRVAASAPGVPPLQILRLSTISRQAAFTSQQHRVHVCTTAWLSRRASPACSCSLPSRSRRSSSAPPTRPEPPRPLLRPRKPRRLTGDRHSPPQAATMPCAPVGGGGGGGSGGGGDHGGGGGEGSVGGSRGWGFGGAGYHGHGHKSASSGHDGAWNVGVAASVLGAAAWLL